MNNLDPDGQVEHWLLAVPEQVLQALKQAEHSLLN